MTTLDSLLVRFCLENVWTSQFFFILFCLVELWFYEHHDDCVKHKFYVLATSHSANQKLILLDLCAHDDTIVFKHFEKRPSSKSKTTNCFRLLLGTIIYWHSFFLAGIFFFSLNLDQALYRNARLESVVGKLLGAKQPSCKVRIWISQFVSVSSVLYRNYS